MIQKCSEGDSKRRFSVIGLGKLGASMAAAIASRGFEVVGVDISQNVVDRFNAHEAPVPETGLAELMEQHHERLRATVSHTEAIHNTDVSFVIVPTPSDSRGAFSLQYAAWAFREIGRALATKNGYHTVVLTSTVLPGSTRYGLLPILERESGKKCGKDFGLCYSPEFIALGSVIRDFLSPDFTLIGEFDARAGVALEACYARIVINSAPCRRMSLENAELAKISLNAYVTTKISFANMLAELCEQIPGGNIDLVTDAIGLDKRIGRKYLTGGLGYGGPCFPRDNVALGFFASMVDTKATLSDTTDRFNRDHADKAVGRLCSLVPKGATVAILGLAYKPFSHVVEESQGVYLASALSRRGMRVVAYDPLARDFARKELHDQAVVLDSIEGCLEQASAVIIATPDPEFAALTAADFKTKPVTVFDFWRILQSRLENVPAINYIAAGRSSDDIRNAERLKKFWRLPD